MTLGSRPAPNGSPSTTRFGRFGTPARAVEVDLLVADPAWLRSLLLRLGREVRRVSPPEAADGARAAAADALIAYAAG